MTALASLMTVLFSAVVTAPAFILIVGFARRVAGPIWLWPEPPPLFTILVNCAIGIVTAAVAIGLVRLIVINARYWRVAAAASLVTAA